jgi:hypothetical protein
MLKTNNKHGLNEVLFFDPLLLIRYILSYCDIRERVFIFDYDTKGKEHQNIRQSDLYSGATLLRTNQIASCFDALSITYLVTISNSYLCNMYS